MITSGITTMLTVAGIALVSHVVEVTLEQKGKAQHKSWVSLAAYLTAGAVAINYVAQEARNIYTTFVNMF